MAARLRGSSRELQGVSFARCVSMMSRRQEPDRAELLSPRCCEAGASGGTDRQPPQGWETGFFFQRFFKGGGSRVGESAGPPPPRGAPKGRYGPWLEVRVWPFWPFSPFFF